MSNTNRKNNSGGTSTRNGTHAMVRKIATIGMLIAVAVLLSSIEIPFPPLPHLKYDPGDIAIIIAALHFGPVAGVLIALIASFVQSFFMQGSGGVYGFIMHLIASGTVALVVGLVYNRKKTSKTNLRIALISSAVAMTVAMIGANLIVTPLYLQIEMQLVIVSMPLTIIFNVVKAVINSIGAGLLYNALVNRKVLH